MARRSFQRATSSPPASLLATIVSATILLIVVLIGRLATHRPSFSHAAPIATSSRVPSESPSLIPFRKIAHRVALPLIRSDERAELQMFSKHTAGSSVQAFLRSCLVFWAGSWYALVTRPLNNLERHSGLAFESATESNDRSSSSLRTTLETTLPSNLKWTLPAIVHSSYDRAVDKLRDLEESIAGALTDGSPSSSQIPRAVTLAAVNGGNCRTVARTKSSSKNELLGSLDDDASSDSRSVLDLPARDDDSGTVSFPPLAHRRSLNVRSSSRLLVGSSSFVSRLYDRVDGGRRVLQESPPLPETPSESLSEVLGDDPSESRPDPPPAGNAWPLPYLISLLAPASSASASESTLAHPNNALPDSATDRIPYFNMIPPNPPDPPPAPYATTAAFEAPPGFEDAPPAVPPGFQYAPPPAPSLNESLPTAKIVIVNKADTSLKNDWSNVFFIIYLIFIGGVGMILSPLTFFYWYRVKKTCDRVQAGSKMLLFIATLPSERVSQAETVDGYERTVSAKSREGSLVGDDIGGSPQANTAGSEDMSQSESPMMRNSKAVNNTGDESPTNQAVDKNLTSNELGPQSVDLLPNDRAGELPPIQISMHELSFYTFFHPFFVFIVLSLLVIAGMAVVLCLIGLLGLALACYVNNCSYNITATRGVWACIVSLLPIYGTPSMLLGWYLRMLWRYWQAGRDYLKKSII